MQKGILITIITLVFVSLNHGQTNSLIKIDGPNGGLVLPTITGVERNAIEQPENGLILMNISTGCLNYYVNANWFELCGLMIPTCSDNGNCQSGEICVDGTCVTDPNACESDEGCPEGMVCSEGQCVSG